MPIKEFRRIVDEAMLNRGFIKLKLVGDQLPVYATGEGDVIRYFGPHSTRRPWGCVMLGAFGVTVPALQAWLADRGESPGLGRLSYYMTNEPQFMDPVSVESEADLPSLSRWLDEIQVRVLSLPAELIALDVLSASIPSKHLLLLKESVPAFWNFFEHWQAERGG